MTNEDKLLMMGRDWEYGHDIGYFKGIRATLLALAGSDYLYSLTQSNIEVKELVESLEEELLDG